MKKLLISSLVILSNYAYAVDQPCYEATRTCIDNAPSKLINGQVFTKEMLGIDCWQYGIEKNCPIVDNCNKYIKQGCIVDPSRNNCTETNDNGTCISWQKTGTCDTAEPTTKTMISCGNEICKPSADGSLTNCYQADPTLDNDFGAAMTALEIANEMGTMKNCYNRYTGNKCAPSDPKDPSKGVDANCDCYFFQGKFVTYKNSFKVWDPAGSTCKVGATFTNCDRVADDFGKTTGTKKPNMLQGAMLRDNALPTRDIDSWSDKGQLNLSLTGNKDTTGINTSNPYVYSFASSSKSFGADGNLSTKDDNWATQNQQNANYQLATSQSDNVINQDDPNAANNQIHWNNGGSQTGQGNTATNNSGTMKVVQDAAKMVSDILDFGSAFSQTCTAEDQSKMINVGKNHCLYNYNGVPGPENGEWILYTYGDKKRFDYQNCTYQTTFWGAATACLAGAGNYATCKSFYGLACSACGIGICPGYCSDLDEFCYGQTLGGHGGQDCGGMTGGNNVIFTGKINCCFSSTISKIITKAAFEQGVSGRPKLSSLSSHVAQYKGTEMCSTDELANGTCNPGNTGINTTDSFQAMCERGISIEEMQQIDFSKVDFSEFYAEAAKGVNTDPYNPNSQTSQNQSSRVQSNVNSQKQTTLQIQGKNYFDF